MLIIWWSPCSPKVCPDFDPCLCSFLLQSSLRYHLLYRFSFNPFFWGGCEDHRKIFWIDWETICLDKAVGGLGVRKLWEFNLALLGKWCWRQVTDREGLWFRLLATRYGIEGGRFKARGVRVQCGGGRLLGSATT